jgi:hypothetical protein
MRFHRTAAYAAELLTICLFVLVPAAALAQAGMQNGRPSIAAARIDASQAPSIDADLSDPGWANATVIDDFKQREPMPGAAPTERTVVRIMFDENNLYVGVYAYDSQPDQIIARAMARDGDLFTGDTIGITLDPGVTRRNAYSFDMGPSGGRADSLLLNNQDDLDEWDPIWTGRARQVADGWVAEMAIPFRSLSYDDDQGVWGFEFSRTIARKNEELRWSSTNPALDFTDVSEAGTLTGITNVNQGIGLDVQVYGALKAKRDWHIPGEDTGISGTAGGNAFYKITPALMGTLTFNPDFSDAPLDVRQVNTTRFSLFFPETRDFFLQDAGAFEFGGTNFAGDDQETNNGRPFFSRNIGLVDGVPVSIIGGGKISGEYAGFGIGGLSVYTDQTESAPGQLLSALRVTRPVLEQSRVGFIFTNGDPTGLTDNTLVGADFQYRDSNLFGDKTILADVFFQRSFSNTKGDDDSFGGSVAFPNEPWAGEFAFKQIGQNFFPALGFVNRTAIRVYDGSVDYIHRFADSFLRTLEFGTEHRFVTDLSDRLETRENQFSISFETNAADEGELDFTSFYELVPEPFDIGDTLIVPAGRYEWTGIEASFETSDARTLALGVQVYCCGFYNGSAVEVQVELGYRPSEYFEIVPGYEATFIELPTGDIDIHVVEIVSVVNFTPDMQLALQLQYDNVSQDFGFLARYRWEYLPGSEFFAALGQGALIGNNRFLAQRTELSIRLGHTLRF